MGYILVAALCLVGGFIIGFGTGISLKEREEEKNKPACLPNYNEVFIDAKTNKEIAQVVSLSDQSEKGRILTLLTEMINEAAQQGRQRLYIEDYSLNSKIKKYLSKKDIESYFSAGGYKIVFSYNYLECAEINFISWE